MIRKLHSVTRIRIELFLFLLGVMLFNACGEPSATIETPESYVIGALTPGQHAVGFKVYHELNHADSFGPRWNDQGDLVRKESPRPVQISVWYPASMPNSSGPMSVKDYLLLDATKTEFRNLNESEKAGFVQNFIGSLRSIVPPHPELVEEYLNLPTTAYAGVSVADGQFPLVLITTPTNTSPWRYAVLAEYLASNGFIVAATPSKGLQAFDASEAANPALGIDTIMATVRDLQFIKAFLREFEGFDGENIAVIGEQSGGWAAAIMMNRDPQVRALVLCGYSLDTEQIKANPALETSLSPDAFRSPILLVTGATQGRGQESTFPLGNEMLYADVYHARISGMDQAAFSSATILLNLKTARHDTFLGLPGAEIGFDQSVLAVKNFLDGIFAERSGAEMVSTGINPEIASVAFEAGVVPPPTSSGFFSVFKNKGATAAMDMLEKIHSVNPDYKVFSADEAYSLGAELRRSGSYEQYLALANIAEAQHPDHATSFFLKGESLMLLKRKDEAKVAFSKMWGLKPSGMIAFQAGMLARELSMRTDRGDVTTVQISFNSRNAGGNFPFAQPFNDPGRFSPDREVRSEIAGEELLIEYGSPSVRGRRVLDELVPTHYAWRTGANEATVFTCHTDVLVQGELLPAGSYALFSIGGENEWTIIFNRVNQQWGAFTYDPIHDQLRVTAPVNKSEHVEEFTIYIDEAEGPSAVVTLAWGKYRVPFAVEAAKQ